MVQGKKEKKNLGANVVMDIHVHIHHYYIERKRLANTFAFLT